ncbi:T9SS type A sorting domain-containing protein [Marivirga sp. S37H4]|uniref:T9SS type A sorting domain-containing protein n=1 Tax=Marivirga aurantiaca TaxID=2802615 RepID=A0A935C8T7_9BACT|nr:T9SS type A sorting domain-containing protein [Marivirga aurantiaca]MBK6265629.1 T9SS type A sorting domain-containing protein [Marivirga aurantiaca]
MKTYILLFIALIFATSGFAQLVVTPSTPVSGYSQPHWNVDSDLNDDYMVVTYGNQNPSTAPGGTGTYMTIFDNVGSPLVQDIPVLNLGQFVSRVKITPDNIIYVLGLEDNNGNTRLVLRKYNTSGIMTGQTVVDPFHSDPAIDLAVTDNNHPLVSLFDGNTLKIKSYSSTLSYYGEIDVDYVTHLHLPTYKLRAHSIDYNDGYLLIGYSRGVDPSNLARIKKYNFNSVSPASSTVSESYSFLGGFHRTVLGVTNSHQVALRNNGDVFYINGVSGIKRISGNNTHSVSSQTKAKVNVDANDKLLISWTNNTKAFARLYDANNSYVRQYAEDGNINGSWAPAFNNCQFIIAGDKSNQATDFHTFRKAHYQVFNCSECEVGGAPTASAEFRSPNQMLEMDSKYGPMEVAELCLVDELLVDGSASCNEKSYFVEIAEFDLVNWNNINILHSDWVSANSQAPSDIDITDFLPQGYQLRPGKVYRFRLAVGPIWHSIDIFFTVSCCKREIIGLPDDKYEIDLDGADGNGDIDPANPEELEVDIYPNPAKDYVTLDFAKEEMLSEASISISNISGKEVFTTHSKEEQLRIDITDWEKGIYVCNITLNGKKTIKRIMKE